MRRLFGSTRTFSCVVLKARSACEGGSVVGFGLRRETESGRQGAGSVERRIDKRIAISGDNGWRVPPVPIPNTAVKPPRADGTWLETARESRSLPESTRERDRDGVSFPLPLNVSACGMPDGEGIPEPGGRADRGAEFPNRAQVRGGCAAWARMDRRAAADGPSGGRQALRRRRNQPRRPGRKQQRPAADTHTPPHAQTRPTHPAPTHIPQ